MRYRCLGRTGLYVSELCLGTMTFGGGAHGWEQIGALGPTEATELVGRALDAGVNFFDTANAYAGGEAEMMLAQALGSRRKDVVIATKVRMRVGKGKNDLGLSRSHILTQVDESLRRLKTDYLDLYQVHLPDSATPMDETLRALEDLVRWGKVRYLGACNFSAWQMMKAVGISEQKGWARFEALQAYYNAVSRELEREIIPFAKDQNIALLIWSPLAGGLLVGDGDARKRAEFPPVDGDRAGRVVEVIRRIAQKHDTSIARVSLAWLLGQESITSLIVGARRIDQLEDNLRATELRLGPEDLTAIERASAMPQEYPGWMLQFPWDERV